MDRSPPQPAKKLEELLMVRMFQGFAFILFGILGAIAFVAVTVLITIVLGFLATVCLYIAVLFMFAVYRIARSIIRNGHRIIHTWDTDAADEQGSTARGGYPQDPGNIIVRKPYSGVRRFTDDDPWGEPDDGPVKTQ